MTNVNLASIGITAVAGAITSGVSVIAGKGMVGFVAKEFATATIDAVESAGRQYVQTGKVSFSKVGTDVVSSKVGVLIAVKVNTSAIKKCTTSAVCQNWAL